VGDTRGVGKGVRPGLGGGVGLIGPGPGG
jgi:hypothetical protein